MSILSDYRKHVSDPLEAVLRAMLKAQRDRAEAAEARALALEQRVEELLRLQATPSAPGGEAAPVAHYRCTRCGENEINARQNGCKRGPCPMEFIG